MAGRRENLKGKGFESRTPEERKEISRKAGIQSGVARRRKKTLKTCAQTLLGLPANKKLAKFMETFGVEEDEATNQMSMLVAMFSKALKGDVKAAQFLAEIAGEDPTIALKKKELRIKEKELEQRKTEQEAQTLDKGSLADVIDEAYKKRSGN